MTRDPLTDPCMQTHVFSHWWTRIKDNELFPVEDLEKGEESCLIDDDNMDDFIEALNLDDFMIDDDLMDYLEAKNQAVPYSEIKHWLYKLLIQEKNATFFDLVN